MYHKAFLDTSKRLGEIEDHLIEMILRHLIKVLAIERPYLETILHFMN
jgi:Holliday junction resolvasome RuvABC endonuclease subunit